MAVTHWYSAWAYKPLDMRIYPLYMRDRKQEFSFISTVAGCGLRLRFSNLYSLSPLRMDAVYVHTAEGAALPVYLDGRERIRLQPGQEILSDGVPLEIAPGDRICVETVFGDCVTDTACTFYENPFCRVRHLDLTGRERLPVSPFFERNPLHRCVAGFDRVLIRTDRPVRTLAAFGDSITHMSRWTGPLAMRLLDAFPGQFVFLNFGVCGNRILHDAHRLSGHGRWFGQAGISRFEADLFTDGIHADEVLLLQGINDLLHPWVGAAPMEECAGPEEILDGLEKMAGIAHKEGAKVSVGTLMPFNGCKQHWTPEREQVRVRVNEGIRHLESFDRVLDWDMWTRSKEDPTRLDPAGGSEDLLHPGVAGGISMAEHVDIAAFFGTEENLQQM